MSVTIKKQNILESKEKIIIHQTNCISTNAKGLAQQLFSKYPYSNFYPKRQNPELQDIPGTIDIKYSENSDNPIIIGLFGQYSVGKPLEYQMNAMCKLDTYDNRKRWFQNGLNLVGKFLPKFLPKTCEKTCKEKITIACPFGIGCGLAGGKWDDYLEMLTNFATEFNIDVVLYKI